MITAGIDAGNKFTKTIIMKDGKIIARGLVYSGFDLKKSAQDALAQALNEAGLALEDIQFSVATGAGKLDVGSADGTISDVSAAVKGATYFCPGARTIVDVGAEGGKAIKANDRAKVIDFAINDKCAAGAGSFVESMARALEIPVEQFGELSLQSDKAVPMNAQCVVFAETEVVSLIHANVPKMDIAKAVNDAIAGRNVSMVRRVGMTKELVLVGGMARNVGYVRAMEEGLEVKALIPEYPEFVSAVGAAVAAQEKFK
ncbi:acyl-CoA dehydratase activase [Desulfoscipio gibsoniae]|uniref:CoA-substrate-specific enzyme activase, putative n=1 Tax=Desulfoscipio gibsoniae DSM 7213 TaxID=767817 RepID=R4KGZ7_9FIRM|nr:acyl-CoA dehydratase activase [Desulfoscipio gibsoniae]AGL00927.1 CoA-substrate-specific enzyme activase, putative [Desulfoscipio gibsoniae DSM 7213]